MHIHNCITAHYDPIQLEAICNGPAPEHHPRHLNAVEMGIPGLSAALRPYGTPTTLSGQSVVIDGPALVHRLWEAIMSQQSLESATLNHVPYAVLGEGFVNWLNLLHAGNVKV